MPKVDKRLKPLAISVGLLLGGLLLYFCWQHPILVGISAAVVLPVGIYETRSVRKHLEALAAARQDDSLCTFAREFERDGLDTWIVRATYEAIQSHLIVPNFPLRSTDRFKEDLKLLDDDLDLEIVPEIAERTKRTFQDSEKNPLFGNVKTVGDVVRFFHAQRKVEA